MAIAGAGIGGLTLGRALSRDAGWHALIDAVIAATPPDASLRTESCDRR